MAVQRTSLVVLIPIVVLGALLTVAKVRPPQPTMSLIEAATAGNLHQIQLHVRRGDGVDQRNALGQTTLSAALAYPEIVRYLLDHGANPNMRAESDETPIMLAAEQNDLAVARLLIQHRASLDETNGDQMTALTLAAVTDNPSVGLSLLTAGANPNLSDSVGATPAHYAAGHGDVELLVGLVKAHADLNRRSIIGVTPLVRAVLNGRVKAAEFLIKHDGMASPTSFSLIHYAALVGAYPAQFSLVVLPNLPAAASYLRETTSRAYSFSDEAVEPRADPMLRMLTKHGYRVNVRGQNGMTPLHLAAYGGNAKAAKTLLTLGADRSLKDAYGHTPLDLARQKGFPGVVAVLTGRKIPSLRTRSKGFTRI